MTLEMDDVAAAGRGAALTWRGVPPSVGMHRAQRVAIVRRSRESGSPVRLSRIRNRRSRESGSPVRLSRIRNRRSRESGSPVSLLLAGVFEHEEDA